MTHETTLEEAIGGLTDIEAKNAPKKLFYQGDLSLLTHGRRVAVVGSRKVSKDGIKRAIALTKALVNYDIIVVSGLAEGVDTVAHQTAIAHSGRTIAVLGTPLDKVYPKSNARLLEVIKDGHLAISQFPEGYPAQKKNFPVRNRTMALISDATIIIEASESSGTRHQGWEALRLGRLVYLLQNVVDKKLSWTEEMLKYGAQVLTKESLEEVLTDIPYTTERRDFAF